MLGVSAMWSSENQRQGFRKCSPLAYILVGLAFVLFIASAVFLVAAIAFILRQCFVVGFSGRVLFILLLPSAAFLLGWSCHMTAWYLVKRKGFVYVYSSDKCSWKNAS